MLCPTGGGVLGPKGGFMTERKSFLRRLDPRGWVELSSPITLGYALIALLVLILSFLTGGGSTRALFSVYRAPMSEILFYPRLFLHVLGHTDFGHYLTNMSLLLVLGPLVEKHYGKGRFLLMIAITALVSGVFHILLSGGTALMGASGVVFMLIILSAAAGRARGKVPLTLLLVAVFYLGRELYFGIFIRDNISRLSHVVGGLCGIAFGMRFRRDNP
jgi:rhomboid protease GluP